MGWCDRAQIRVHVDFRHYFVVYVRSVSQCNATVYKLERTLQLHRQYEQIWMEPSYNSLNVLDPAYTRWYAPSYLRERAVGITVDTACLRRL